MVARYGQLHLNTAVRNLLQHEHSAADRFTGYQSVKNPVLAN